MIDPNILLEAAAAVVTAIGGIYAVLKKWYRHSQEKKAKYRQDILNEASSEAIKFKEELEEKIKKLETELDTQKQNIYKDTGYLKESHSNEIRNLTEKIEELREDLKIQHVGILNLLTKLIDTK